MIKSRMDSAAVAAIKPPLPSLPSKSEIKQYNDLRSICRNSNSFRCIYLQSIVKDSDITLVTKSRLSSQREFMTITTKTYTMYHLTMTTFASLLMHGHKVMH